MERDYQKSRLYRWEDKFVRPYDQSFIDLSKARAVVNYVWEGEGLRFPPRVEQAPPNVRRFAGRANREVVSLVAKVPTWVVLHEVSHSLNASIDNVGDGHGPKYLGLYMKILSKYLDIPLPLLMYTAKHSGLDFDIMAVPAPAL